MPKSGVPVDDLAMRIYLIVSFRDSEFEVVGMSTVLDKAIELSDGYGPETEVLLCDLAEGTWVYEYPGAVVHKSPARPEACGEDLSVDGWLSGRELPSEDGVIYECEADGSVRIAVTPREATLGEEGL